MKLCIDCAHIVRYPDPERVDLSKCARYGSIVVSMIDGSSKDERAYAENARNNESQCGAEARGFEPAKIEAAA